MWIVVDAYTVQCTVYKADKSGKTGGFAQFHEMLILNEIRMVCFIFRRIFYSYLCLAPIWIGSLRLSMIRELHKFAQTLSLTYSMHVFGEKIIESFAQRLYIWLHIFIFKTLSCDKRCMCVCVCVHSTAGTRILLPFPHHLFSAPLKSVLADIYNVIVLGTNEFC